MNEATTKAVSEMPGRRESDVERHYQSLLRYSYALTKNRAEAEDIAQETLARYHALVRKDSSTEPLSAIGYLRGIARNLCNDVLRARNRTPHTISLDDKHNKDLLNQLVDVSTCEAIQNNLYYEELLQRLPLRVVLVGLNEYELGLLRMHAVEEMTAVEIAAAVGRDPSEVRYHLNRMLAKLRYRARKLLLSAP